MKILKLVTFLLVSVLVFGCEKAKENTVDNVNDESLVAVQNAMIEPIKKALPIAIDELTTLIGIDKDKDRNIVNYQYEVKNTSEHTLLLPSTFDTIRQALFKAYCENNEEMQQLKTAFPDGANYHYFIDNKEIIVVELTPADCHGS
ncbi:hypothetical protein [Gilliamella apis]|uniref:hypothetical protein n=1 Tax=Gilliamella apis TaxID=1970738 RepID=UPI000A353064|nr:hypothetical protein [Gilliamella apis]OTQ36349.1 hypothetical protein B6C84_03205 [Gilliamella apis]OTQ37695.1 hypothetical protein B6C88_05140 [Gilliamella apis]OTQ41914.1 hypothetical protein B6C94_07825 [Gilliamella apis]OTQ42040.1 hypothetical protein B6D26_01240 [Gilliamella apis]OTQ45648.1 hypothetical protein B6C86_06680 [Gilliamella apis]